MSERTAIVWGAGGGLTHKLVSEGWRVIAVTQGPAHVEGAAACFDANLAEPFSVQRAVMAAGQETDSWRKVPFKMPPGAFSAEQLAEKALEILTNGTQGNVDL
jgi:hypothetical protein